MKLLLIYCRLFMWQWKEQIYFVKQRGYTYCPMIMFYEKTFCFKRLSNFKTEVVFFILKLLIKLVYSFISQNTKKLRFIKIQDCFRLISVKILNNHNSRQENASLLRYQRRPVKLSHNFASCD